MSIDSVAVPVLILKDGRQFISDQDIEGQPEIAEFVRRFPLYLVRHPELDGFVGPCRSLPQPDQESK